MSISVRTDLAQEAYEMLTEAAEELSGIESHNESTEGIGIHRVLVKTDEAASRIGKPCGNYITVELPSLSLATGEEISAACRLISKELRRLLSLSPDKTVLVIGLGNRSITPDALGPEVVSQLLITRHLFSQLSEDATEHFRPVCAISPGVLGITGIETEEIVRGVVEKVKPDCVLCIDALAARSMHRVGATVQLCDTGIAPGAGVGNRRHALNRETLGVPVIALGVPTVIDAATITADTLSLITKALKKESGKDTPFLGVLSTMEPEDCAFLAKDALSSEIGNFIVTPKEVDLLIDKISKLVADSINHALFEDLSPDEITEFLS
ncbi:MAG: GPR endopeptidase [Clostridia bacterium]|nr:GPR endopeptidase [Clostridia bacterium]